jgi:hypothetical protein
VKRRAAIVVIAAGISYGLMAGTSLAAGLPNLFSTSIQHGSRAGEIFSVRPRKIYISSVDGAMNDDSGELTIRWTKWTQKGGWGAGICSAAETYPVRVRVFDVKKRVRERAFTRLNMTQFVHGKAGKVHHLIFAYQNGLSADSLGWIALSLYHDRGFGATAWPIDLGP